MGLPEHRKDVLIQESGEPLVTISGEKFHFADEHPYWKLGAPYGEFSPYMVRASVLKALEDAADCLRQLRKGYKLSIYDAFRPRQVQAFMVQWECRNKVRDLFGKDYESATQHERNQALEETYKLWAKPSDDRSNPPPHTTGGAVDVTIVDQYGTPMDMGSEIDALEGADPMHFVDSKSPELRMFHANRMFLKQIMERAGFVQLEHEWWHYSLGDQYWALAIAKRTLTRTNALVTPVARYGWVEFLTWPR